MSFMGDLQGFEMLLTFLGLLLLFKFLKKYQVIPNQGEFVWNVEGVWESECGVFRYKKKSEVEAYRGRGVKFQTCQKTTYKQKCLLIGSFKSC